MIGPGRGGAPLLAGLSAGAVLVAALVLTGPADAPPRTLHAALGAPLTTTTAPDPAPTPRAVPSRRAVVPVPVVPIPVPIPVPLPTTTAAPEPTTTTPPPPPEPPAEVGLVEGVVDATNAERLDAGCDAVRVDSRLVDAAQGHSEDMAEHDYFSHTGRDGSTFADRIRAEGHPSPGGENIARGHESAAEVVRVWMDSPGHRRNILDCDFVGIGVGFDGRGNYWTQEFGR